MCVDYDELEIAKWLIARGMDVNERAAVDKDGFGGHTARGARAVSPKSIRQRAGHATHR
jgi:hypothetical protein